MHNRLKELRLFLDMSQEEFGRSVNVSKPTISALENATRSITPRVVNNICEKHNVNENWLRNGIGKMFIEPAPFSLDEYAKSNNLKESELNLVHGFMALDPNIRNALYDLFKKAFANEES